MVGKESSRVRIVIEGEINMENVEWLQRSLVGEHFKPINHPSLSCCLREGDRSDRKVVKVRAMGSFMALVMFESKEAMIETLHRDLD